jgi:hypothetical protein
MYLADALIDARKLTEALVDILRAAETRTMCALANCCDDGLSDCSCVRGGHRAH